VTKQRTYNRRRAHWLRKKDNWSTPRSDIFINGVFIGCGKLLGHELRMYKGSQWTDDQLDALKNPIEMALNVVWQE
jgi:hypothetical protein